MIRWFREFFQALRASWRESKAAIQRHESFWEAHHAGYMAGLREKDRADWMDAYQARQSER